MSKQSLKKKAGITYAKRVFCVCFLGGGTRMLIRKARERRVWNSIEGGENGMCKMPEVE